MIQTSAFDELLELQGICECWTRHVGTLVFLSFSQHEALFVVTTEVQSHISRYGMLTLNMD